ncbi:ParA family protein [Archangium lansingense]|uniref:AAA family ATPase n=1 Tax=Archangium lansingense TaxID=2995310 RepID=A0ABT4A5P5_9BACT|nr:AAA family ATPase [Archangium lansinium]MCY1076329.1 AAA family ATPase [Archangium lansinium]
MKILSIINYKGGVGKTTITANLAAELAFRGYSVLAVDLDPQASLTFSFVRVDEWQKHYEQTKTIKNWYDAFIDEDTELDLSSLIIQPKTIGQIMAGKGKMDLICSHLGLRGCRKISVIISPAERSLAVSERASSSIPRETASFGCSVAQSPLR